MSPGNGGSLVAEKWRERLFNKKLDFSQAVRQSIGADACPMRYTEKEAVDAASLTSLQWPL